MNLLLRFAVVAAVVCHLLVVFVAADPPCAAYPNCHGCVGAASETCGWCDGECVRGTAEGGTDQGKCNAGGSAWHWHGFHCPNASDCSQYVTCDECGSNAECGWCDTAGTGCMRGTSSGPTSGQCVSSGSRDGGSPWHWGGQRCPPPTPPPPTPVPFNGCHLLTSCSSCTASSIGNCGWCNNTCFEGTSQGPDRGLPVCNGTLWYWDAHGCPVPPPSCSLYTSCDLCTSDAGLPCGWCDGQCLDGTATGPAQPGLCHGDLWSWDESSCPGYCTQHESCSGCTETFSGACGWCGGHCFRGNSKGPTGNATCPPGSHWTTKNDHCPVDCSEFTDCRSCWKDGNEQCGWCAGGQPGAGVCFNGNATSPHQGQCPNSRPGGEGSSNHWYWQVCPAHCAHHKFCDACTLSNSQECGWCGDNQDGACFQGNRSGPLSGGCPNHETWLWHYDQCPPPPPPPSDCPAHTSCDRCTEAPSGACGWCGSAGGQCERGTKDGPANASSCTHGKPWHWVGNHCPAPPLDCPFYTDCFACTQAFNSDSGCGWCATTQLCSLGNSAGPSSGRCPAHSWHWVGTNCPTPAPPPPDCSHLATCSECVNAPSGRCGFCSADKVCSAGTQLGPLNGTRACAGLWQWTAATCPSTQH